MFLTNFRRLFLSAGLFLLPAVSLFAQLTVVQGSAMNMTPEQLVQNHLVGAGITVSNCTFNGSSTLITSNQIGTFETDSTATTQLGLTGGILMTSGRADIAIGPNNTGGAGSNTGGSGDPDLNILSGSTTFDKAILEFDFIPQYDTVRFSYVFGSEEFFEYCHQFNDAFGFFISGPGISGSFSNNSANIALMPGSQSVYVTIDNICDNQFSRWDNAGGVFFQYDALTHVFTAMAVVQPCSTYHIKLAVADAIDHAYDSGVFLEENSFSSLGVELNNSNTNPGIGNVAVEGCNDVTVNFNLSGTAEYDYRIDFTIGGTATNGVDYALIPNFVIFPAGTDSITLVIHPLLDLVPEGEETIILTIQQISCDGSVTADTLSIFDYIPMSIQHQPDTTVCHGNEVTLEALVAEGMYPYIYHWNVSPLNDSIIDVVLPVGNNTCIATVEDLCFNTIYDTTLALVHPKPNASAGSDMIIPNGTSTSLSGNASGGYGTYSYHWESNPPGFNSNEQNPSTGNLYFSTMFLLTVTDLLSQCISDPDEVIVAIEGGPLTANPVANPPEVCLGTETQLFALAGGGSGFYTYSWSSNPPGFASTDQNPFVTPASTTTYTLTVNDSFNEFSGSTEVTVYPLPVIHLGPADTLVCIYDTLILDAGNPGSAYEWSNGSESRTVTVASTGIGYEVQTITVTVTNENGCIDSASLNVIFSFSACTGIPKGVKIPVRIVPNPSDGVFRVELQCELKPITFTLYDIFGKEIFREQVLPTERYIKHLIIVDKLPPGIYLLNWKNDVHLGTEKIIIR